MAARVRPVAAAWTVPEMRTVRDGTPAFGFALAAPALTLWISLFAAPVVLLAWQAQRLPDGAFARLLRHAWPCAPVAGGPFDVGFGIVAITLAAVVVGLGAGVPAAYAVARHPFRGAGALHYLVLLPLLVPAPALAVALCGVLHLRGFQWPAWVAAAALANVPLVVWCTRAAARHAVLAPLEETAAACGLTPAARFVEVALPTLSPQVAVAALAAAALTCSELTIATALGHAWADAFAEASRALGLTGTVIVPLPNATGAVMPVRESAAWAAAAPPAWIVTVGLLAPAVLRVLCVAAWSRRAHRAPSATPWGIA